MSTRSGHRRVRHKHVAKPKRPGTGLHGRQRDHLPGIARIDVWKHKAQIRSSAAGSGGIK